MSRFSWADFSFSSVVKKIAKINVPPYTVYITDCMYCFIYSYRYKCNDVACGHNSRCWWRCSGGSTATSHHSTLHCMQVSLNADVISVALE